MAAATASVLPGESVLMFRERIAVVQSRYSTAASEALVQADEVVQDAIGALNQALLERAASLRAWREIDQPESTDLDSALHEYNEYLNRVLSL